MVEEYASLRELKDTTPRGLRALCPLADLDRALRRMPPKEYQAVLLHGLLDIEDAEKLLGYSRATLYRKYIDGLEILTNLLNGVEP